MSPILKWGLVAFGIGILIVISDIYMASKKKEGIEVADKQRIWGLFWLSCFAGALTSALVWLGN